MTWSADTYLGEMPIRLDLVSAIVLAFPFVRSSAISQKNELYSGKSSKFG
jgi:hypothetical protein